MSVASLDHHTIIMADHRLTLGDVYRSCTSPGLACEIKQPRKGNDLSQLECQANVELAYHTANLRGARTIQGLTAEEMLANGKAVVCPLTLQCGDLLRQAQLLPWYDDEGCPEAPPLDFLAQMLEWLPLDVWGCVEAKGALSNLVLVDDVGVKSPMSWHAGSFVPTMQQLARLIVEVERRAAAAVSTAAASGPDATFTFSTAFGASTASTSIQVGSDGEADGFTEGPGVKDRNVQALHAHEYDFECWNQTSRIKVYNDAAPKGYTLHDAQGQPEALTEYRPSLPSFDSFVSPSAAVMTFVFMVNHWQLQPRTPKDEGRWAMVVYFCKLCFMTKASSLATVLATRPRPTEVNLPDVDDEVASCARRHATDEQHRRAFPTYESSSCAEQQRRKRKRPRGGEEVSLPGPSDVRAYEVERLSRPAPGSRAGPSDDVFYSWRIARKGSKAEAEANMECLRSAIWHYEGASNDHTQRVIEIFDGGRGFDLYDLLRGWPAVYEAIGDARATELKALREKTLESRTYLQEWVKEVVKGLQRAAEEGEQEDEEED